MTQWKCDKCGAEFKLEDIPEECPNCKTKIENPTALYCARCGKKIIAV